MSDLSFLQSGSIANRPAVDPLLEGRWYFATDEKKVYRQTADTWEVVVQADGSAAEASLRKLGTAETEAAAGDHIHEVDVKYGSWFKHYGTNDGGQTYQNVGLGQTSLAALSQAIYPANYPSEYLAVATFKVAALDDWNDVRFRLYKGKALWVESGQYLLNTVQGARFLTHFFGPSPWGQTSHVMNVRLRNAGGTGVVRVTPVSLAVIELYPTFQAPAAN